MGVDIVVGVELVVGSARESEPKVEEKLSRWRLPRLMKPAFIEDNVVAGLNKA